MKHLKSTVLLILVFFGVINYSFAHEEPAKTLKEKKEKEEKRNFILTHKITSSTVWKYQIIENTPNENSKEKYYTSNYDKNGNFAEMLVYKSSDSLDYKVVFGFDENFNMLSDIDYNADGSLAEKIEYKFDEQGRVILQLNYLNDGIIDSRFNYTRDNQKNTLTLTKINTKDSIEYEIIYQYEASVDNGNNIGITQQSSDGKLMLRVENSFNDKNQRTTKKIYNENNELTYYFEYTYFDNTNEFLTIIKKSANAELIAKTEYFYNEAGLVEKIISTDKSEAITSYMGIIYTFN